VEIALQQGQLELQTQLLEASEIMVRQSEMLEHQLRSAAQLAGAKGPPGVYPRAGIPLLTSPPYFDILSSCFQISSGHLVT